MSKGARTISPLAVPSEAGSRDKSSFQVLDRTFSILELFDDERPEWTTTEVARALWLPVPTAHRILVARSPADEAVTETSCEW